MKLPAFLQKQSVQRAIKAVLAIAVLGYLVYVVEPEQIAEAVARAHWSYVFAALALLPLNVLLEGVVWKRILRAVLPSVGWPSVYGALFCGFSLGLFTPARAGEFAGRALYFERGDRWAIAATVFVQRLLDMAAGVGAGTVALAYALGTGLITASPAWWGVLAIGAGTSLSLAGLLLMPGRTTQWIRRLISSEKVLRRLAFLERLRRRRMARTFALAALRYLTYATQLVLLVLTFAPAASAFLLAVGVALVFLAKFLLPSLTLLDVGVREGAAVFFLGHVLGIPDAAALNAALLIFFLNVLLPAVPGVPLILRLNLTGKEGGRVRKKEGMNVSA